MGTPDDVAKGLDLFKTLVFDNAVDAVLVDYGSWLLAVPVIGPIFSNFMHYLADSLYAKLSGAVVFGSILFVDVRHRQQFDTAQAGLKAIAIAKGIDSPEFKEAHEEEKQALKKMGQFSPIIPS